MSDINLLADEEQEKGFKGYYLKIGECDFTTPAIKREGFKILPKLVQVTDEQRVASGKLVIKVLQQLQVDEVTLNIILNKYNAIAQNKEMTLDYLKQQMNH